MNQTLRRTIPAVALMATAVIGTAVVTNAIASGPSSAASSPAVAAVTTHDGRGPGGGLGAVAEELGLDLDVLRQAVEDGSTIAEAATAQGVDQTTLVAALVANANVRLDAAVADGRITQEEADERKATAEERITEQVTSEDASLGRGGPGGPGRPDGIGPGGFGLGGLDDVAEELGIDLDELRASIQEGNTLAEAAAAQGVSEDALVDALMAAAEERIRELINLEPGQRPALPDGDSPEGPSEQPSESPSTEGSSLTT